MHDDGQRGGDADLEARLQALADELHKSEELRREGAVQREESIQAYIDTSQFLRREVGLRKMVATLLAEHLERFLAGALYAWRDLSCGHLAAEESQRCVATAHGSANSSSNEAALVVLLSRRERAARAFVGRRLTREMEATLRGTLLSWADVAKRLRSDETEASLRFAFAAWQEVFVHQCVFRLRGAFEGWVDQVQEVKLSASSATRSPAAASAAAKSAPSGEMPAASRAPPPVANRAPPARASLLNDSDSSDDSFAERRLQQPRRSPAGAAQAAASNPLPARGGGPGAERAQAATTRATQRSHLADLGFDDSEASSDSGGDPLPLRRPQLRRPVSDDDDGSIESA